MAGSLSAFNRYVPSFPTTTNCLLIPECVLCLTRSCRRHANMFGTKGCLAYRRIPNPVETDLEGGINTEHRLLLSWRYS